MHKTLSFQVAAFPLPLHVDGDFLQHDDAVVLVVFVAGSELAQLVDLQEVRVWLPSKKIGKLLTVRPFFKKNGSVF
jgi:hypothetical protein